MTMQQKIIQDALPDMEVRESARHDHQHPISLPKVGAIYNEIAESLSRLSSEIMILESRRKGGM
jgi:hypothetical protein